MIQQSLTEVQKGAQQLKRALIMLSIFMTIAFVVANLIGLGVPRGVSMPSRAFLFFQ